AAAGSLRPLVQALCRGSLRVLGHDYRGLEIRDAARGEAVSGLLAVRPADIVGNDDYLRAGLRLARDVAGYDFAARRNPKRLNPVLFGLGRPGCGKTVTAHAIGNDFLDYCRARDVPARFIVVRRTDWASSYQNASALNLVRIFEEEVYGFEGVCGVYWPDIDTAFASRSSSGLRMEEKQNLGAVFGIFDGTLLPRDGKWFLVCDANTLHMDEAAQSRIAQNPFTVTGPTTPEHFVRLMRDLELRDVVAFCDVDEAGWGRIGARAAALGLSGRGVSSICGNLVAHVQDFELPDAWFGADAAERQRILAALGQRIDEARVLEQVERWARFHAEAEARDEQARFEQEVDGLVRRLNAGRVAAQRVQESAATLEPRAQEPS
ncbi:MAG: AAA family ATPase, partial [Myxococcales bacterium]|nr:AAA family ATPase [Myxococcales bacterium]